MGETIKDFKRTHLCGEISKKNKGEEIIIMGWVQKRRDHGGVIFADIRDRSGIVQVVFNPDIGEDSFAKADQLRSEYVVAIKGEVELRPEGNINPDIYTGEIEIKSNELRILDKAKTPPIQVEDDIDAGEDIRLKYRYLDLRRPKMTKIMGLRHKITKATRDYLDENGFWEIETPILTKSTPEGARDYLVPSRVNPGQFFALPQSPQIFKQLLMVSGMERYFQIARCFRDEDLRANRQPEFTQIDMEMSFVNREDVFEITNGLMEKIFAEAEIEVPSEIKKMPYQEAMDRFGTDKPDLRFAMELKDLSSIVEASDFNIFSGTVKSGGQVKGINFKGGADSSRSEIDSFEEHVKLFKAKGLAWIALRDDELKSPIAKFLSEEEIDNILSEMEAEEGDLLLIVADKAPIVAAALANLRLKIAKDYDLIPEEVYEFVWIIDFPLFEYDEEEDCYQAKHHPFAAPIEADIDKLEEDPASVRADAYDLVLNGEELGGGSIRINNRPLQEKVFSVLSLSEEEQQEKFGFLLEAFDYGTPPHGGIAFGMDRLMMITARTDSIRDVIAFPKTQRATSPLTNAPSNVAEKQLKELGLSLLS
ncbi:aspartate--tRNA ligase [Halanaerobium sp. Z-7514]|uniref:Aspartate--tRNA(Asp/Asn) ligase n=1 Tax=Halanaerobium polyolivorans TaxID=2886943 RepID=A0AAW4X0L6_9FIRM|nr:aspartate--tRNA ligase [Halanaerobium polyolivorans]MCC3145354.1 aspartate--tRNA ligase [Halanaerobium polyolivorans]RQD77150.1 MAG: aspartate--tRNA ligase [Halanaerobium sp. MSAO_Bac5]